VSVFVIINEWTDVTGDGSSEVVDSKYFDHEGSAWDALRLIAESYHVDLGETDTSISLRDHDEFLNYEEYYIQELTKGN
jgi:hypothetical protein